MPVTMTAFSQDMIEELGMTSDEDLEQLVPGLQFAYDSEGNGITIRGIGTQKAVEYNADLAVAFYVDGVYTNDVYGLAPNLFDVERVEVARGPQGTLNGRNSIAGAVSYVNRKPSDDWDAQVLVEFTDTVTQRYNAAWGGPITDEVSFRLTGGYYEGDGWQENTGIGDNYAAPDQYTFAPQLRYETDRLDINLRRQVARDRGTSRAPVRMVDVDRDSPTYLLGGIWPVTNYLYLYQKPLPGIANCDPAQFRDRGGFCDELENRVPSNRSSIQDHETDRWSLNTDVAVGDLARHRTRCTDGSLYRGNRASPILEYTANVDGTEIWGAEVEWAFYATDQFRVSGYYNYLDSSLGPHMAYIDGDRDGDTLGTFLHSWIDEETGQRMETELTNMRDNTGNRLPQMPNHKGAVTVAYTQPLETAGTVDALATWSYTGFTLSQHRQSRLPGTPGVQPRRRSDHLAVGGRGVGRDRVRAERLRRDRHPGVRLRLGLVDRATADLDTGPLSAPAVGDVLRPKHGGHYCYDVHQRMEGPRT